MNTSIGNTIATVGAATATEQFWSITGIIAVIILGGLIGGWGAHLLTAGLPGQAEGEQPSKLRFLILGVIAAACVPLFLSLVQSGIVREMMSNALGNRAESYLIFAGLCLVAALTARNFLDSLSKRVLRDLEKLGNEVEDTRRVAKAADAKATGAEQKVDAVAEVVDEQEAREQETSGSATEGIDEPIFKGAFSAPVPHTSETEHKVLRALTHMTFRTATGVAKDVGIPRSQIGELLDALAERGLAAPTVSPTTGGARWKITPVGVAALSGR